MKKAFVVALAGISAATLATVALGAGNGGHSTGNATLGDVSPTTERAAARRATATYIGPIRKAGQGAQIRVRARVRRGRAIKVKSMDYLARMKCEKSGVLPGNSAGWAFPRGVGKVNRKRRFSIRGSDGASPESTLTFKGRFSRNFKSVSGTFRTKQWFEEQKDPPLPAEYCTLGEKNYSATR